MFTAQYIPPTIFELKEILEDPKITKAVRSQIPWWHPRNDGEEGSGGSGEGGSGAAEGTGSGSGTGEEGSSGAEGTNGSGSSGSGEGEGKGGKDDDTVVMSKDEAARLRRLAREADETKKKAKQDKEAAERKKKQEEGRFQELVDEERAKTVEAETRAERAEKELVKFKFQIKVNEIASNLGFEDPSDAHLYLSDDDLEATDKVLEGQLTKVLRQKPHLKSKRKATGGNGGGGTGPAGGLTIEDIKLMSAQEINKRWDEVQKVMQNS